MPGANDIALVREYAERHSESAFAEIVGRHINLVYSVAFRFSGNGEDAQDVTQVVFVILAQKASRLRAKTILTGWLYETTRFTAMKFLRTKARRKMRERDACRQSILNENSENVWRQLVPLLEEAMTRLNEKERAFVALRFFENRTVAETAAALGIQEWAARKRSERIMEKLRSYFSKCGVTSTTAAIAGAISANATQAAPVLLAKSVMAVALGKGVGASTSTVSLIKGALKAMAWTKAKTTIMASAGVLLAAAITVVIVGKIKEPVIDDSWRRARLDSQTLDRLPSQIGILPTTFASGSRRGIRGPGVGADRKLAGLGFQVSAIFATAYGLNDARTVFVTTEPTNRYDFICTVHNQPREALQNALKKEFGLAGRLEMRETDVLLLTAKYPNAPGLKPSIVATSSSSLQGRGGGHLSGVNVELRNLANDLEQRLNLPVIDQTGLANRHFDFELTWDQSDPLLNIEGLKRALVDQLGLELIPAREPTEMLVIDKANN